MATASSSNIPENAREEIRVGPQTRIEPCVRYALQKFEENEDMIIVFHSFPVAKVKPANATDDAQADHTSKSLLNSTLTIPRLISIVEILKREFIKALVAKHSTRLAGLHQYNETGCLEDLGYSSSSGDTEEDRAAEIVRALSGKNHVSQKQTPYLKITLSHRALPELVGSGTTYQPPALRTLSKSAKARRKRREVAAKKGKGAEDSAEDTPSASETTS